MRAKGDLRCIEGRLFRHDPQHDDPDLETDVGECHDCYGKGCEMTARPAPAASAREPLKPCPRGITGCDCGAEYCRRCRVALGYRTAMEPDRSRPGIFANHNCWKCKDGADLSKCPTPSRPGNCGHPHARND